MHSSLCYRVHNAHMLSCCYSNSELHNCMLATVLRVWCHSASHQFMGVVVQVLAVTHGKVKNLVRSISAVYMYIHIAVHSLPNYSYKHADWTTPANYRNQVLMNFFYYFVELYQALSTNSRKSKVSYYLDKI